MQTVDADIREVDVVELTERIGRWPAGSHGAAVIDHGDEKLLAMAGERDDPLDLPVVPVSKLRLVARYR